MCNRIQLYCLCVEQFAFWLFIYIKHLITRHQQFSKIWNWKPLQYKKQCIAMCMHTHAHTRTHTYTHTRTHTRARAHTHRHTHARARGRARAHSHTHTHARTHTRTHALLLSLKPSGRCAIARLLTIGLLGKR